MTASDDGYRESAMSQVASASTREMSDDELLTMLQEACFRYYWDGGDPHSGMARENIPGDDRIVLPRHPRMRITAVPVVTESSSANDRLDFLHFAVENRIKVVSIFLDAKDDPQIIFEALNHRGVRLDAADLVKNLLFQMLDRQGDHHLEHELLNDHWSVLDSGHWREEVTTGRIKRVRVDILLAYWLSAQRGEESSVEHLFEDFKRWMRASQARAADVIRDIRVYADTMDRLQRLPMSSPVAQALDRLDATKTTTPWPLILFLHALSEIPRIRPSSAPSRSTRSSCAARSVA